MARRKMKLEDRIERSVSQLPQDFLPNEEGADPIKIDEDVRKDFSRAKWETSHHLEALDNKYKTHENDVGMKEYKGSLDGIVGYANDLADFVKHDEYQEIGPNDPNAEGRIINYIAMGLAARSGGKVKPDQAMDEARKKFYNFINPEEGKNPDRETLNILKAGLRATHTSIIMRRADGIFAGYSKDEGKRKQLAALIAAIAERDTGEMMDMTTYHNIVPQAISYASAQINEFAKNYSSHGKESKAEHEYKPGS
ncbi:hypothetical protein GOV07_03725 [Candidatus Woesearchaeota archaeon]|nr:hypothetical protein [Candidatus Woesearchaeota archaeon]